MVNSVRLRFYVSTEGWSGQTNNFAEVAIFQNTADWSEGTVTFADAPAHATQVDSLDHFGLNYPHASYKGFTGTNLLVDADAGWLEFTGAGTKSLVEGWLNGTVDNYGVSVSAIGDYVSNNRYFSLKTSEAVSSVRPGLIVDYTVVSEPATVSSGLVFSILSTERSVPLPEVQAFLDKVGRGEPITVAYLGGSITVGASCWPLSGIDAAGEEFDFSWYDRDLHSWRALTFEWLRQTYGQTPGQFRQWNAAIGGTPSLLGTYRLEQDVLSQNPDLVFVEFAVNDSYAGALTEQNPAAPKSILRTSRSIVDRLRAQNSNVLVFMPLSTHRVLEGSASEAWSVALDLGHDQTRMAAEMLRVPYVSIKDAFEALRPAGQDPYFGGTDTAGNYVHPAPAGHRAYAETVEASLGKLFQTGSFVFRDSVDAVAAYPVIPRLILPDALAAYAAGWQIETPATVEVPVLEGHACLVGDDTDGALEYTFTGSSVGLWMDNQTQGTVAVQLDGTALGTFSGRFNSLSTSLDPATSHTIRLTPSAGSHILLWALTVDCDGS